MIRLRIALLIGFIVSTCTTIDSGEKKARKYCTSCHQFPEPSLLDKNTWETKVLPAMGKLMDVRGISNDPFEEMERKKPEPNDSIINKEDWQKIVRYYLLAAPEKNAPQIRVPIKFFTSRFKVKMPSAEGKTPFNTFLKIDPGNKKIYVANGWDSSLNVYDHQLNLLQKNKVDGILIDIFFQTDIHQPGKREGVFTNIGILNPNSFYTGSTHQFQLTTEGIIGDKKVILDSLPRPVQTISVDLDMDGKNDYLTCGFGNKTGSFSWWKQKADGKFEERIIRKFPGAIKAYIDDFNHDGLPDILTLFSQAEEGFFLFTNKGDGTFRTTKLISFPPVYGSSSFEMVDMNKDGLKDILYTCGDNADYSNVLKSYHGIYIFIKKGKNSFRQAYFFPLHGAYKAVAKDFDKDGDVDIASISYFPDKKNQPQEGFVYLENKGSFNFSPYSIKEFDQGHWITMDAGDIDQDGDEDIIIGSLFLPQELERNKTDLTKKPLFLLLDNQAVKK